MVATWFKIVGALGLCAVFTACASNTDTPPSTTSGATQTATAHTKPNPAATEAERRSLLTDTFHITEVATFDAPWALTFVANRAYVTEKTGQIWHVDPATGAKTKIQGGPTVRAEGQGGLGDIIPTTTGEHHGFLISYVEWDGKKSGAVVAEYKYTDTPEPRLSDPKILWRQTPKTTGTGHYSHRVAISPDGLHLFISSGDRQKKTPAQNLNNMLGTIIRVNRDGSAPADNPFAHKGKKSAAIWSYGHRNPLGLAFDADGRLWSHEMGPQGGDEFNLIKRGANYGWPKASNGDHYDGTKIPNHTQSDGFESPQLSWNPSISPSGLTIYNGQEFPQWNGDAFLGALSGKALVHVDLDGDTAAKAHIFEAGARIRDVAQGPQGALWIIEDGAKGRLLKLTNPK